MTVLTKPSIIIKKTRLISEDCDTDDFVIDVEPKRSARSTDHAQARINVICTLMIIIFVMAAFSGAVIILVYQKFTASNSVRHFRGFCAIPLTEQIRLMEAHKAALRWNAIVDALPPFEQNAQAVAIGEDADMHALLNELLDINVEDSLERIAVYKNGHPVSFLHDFESNITGIVDESRCFVMDMDHGGVLPPQLFVLGLQRGEPFDVALVLSSMRAELPPQAAPAPAPAPAAARGMAERCSDRPTYKLEKKTGTVIRKRDAEEPTHHYVQFAGKNVQQIEISNMPDLLRYEQALKQPA